ncbi:PAS domain-containing protein [Pseudomonas oryzihabitans]|uniref:PAS domain-containing protein n=1 Tax=Pseudomonas oryzihabitans TaxID=47885 RepID=UPI000736F762|nr:MULTISPECIES: PAS domain-containing protein [Pseudomonas]KTT55377.1 chemotaxis protein CheY [Pseudomonas psychrotolerans]HCV75276.1 hybrid sensor histidine kinase/response regulator [Pseudomonas sp.]
MPVADTPALLARLAELEQHNQQLRQQLDARAVSPESSATLASERYQFLFNAMDEGFCIIEFLDGPHGPLSDYIHVEANPAYAAHAGIPNVVGQKLRDMVGDEAQAWLDRYGHVLRTGEPIRFEQELVATGRYLELTAFRIEPASRRQVAVLFQDITPRKRAEIALRQLNETLEERVQAALAANRILANVVDAASAMIHVLDFDFRWLAVNGSGADLFEQVFGVRPQLGASYRSALDSRPEISERLSAQWQRAFTGEAFNEIVSVGEAPLQRHYELQFSPLLDADGQRIGAYQFAYDVTERLNEQERIRLMEEALRQSQKMEAVGQLTGGIAHDFNNLLTGILGSLEMLDLRLRQGRLQDLERYTGTARSAAQRAAALTHRLLAFSRRQTLDPQPVALEQLVIGLEDLIQRSIGPQIALEREAAPRLWLTHIDALQLENALLNLCLNARDAMPDGGRIRILLSNERLDATQAELQALPVGDFVRLSVGDTGSGMSDEVLARVFDPFFTTKPIGQGTGLGLSMVHGFVLQSGGEIRIDSTPGAGTWVHLYLPRHHLASLADSALPVEPEPHSPGQGETILVVDDEPTIRTLLVEVMIAQGYRVLEAADAATALALLMPDTPLDLLVTDVGLPGALNGRQLADALRGLRPELPVLFITGYAEGQVIDDAHLETGMRVLTKPFTLDTLERRIQAMLQRA